MVSTWFDVLIIFINHCYIKVTKTARLNLFSITPFGEKSDDLRMHEIFQDLFLYLEIHTRLQVEDDYVSYETANAHLSHNTLKTQ